VGGGNPTIEVMVNARGRYPYKAFMSTGERGKGKVTGGKLFFAVGKTRKKQQQQRRRGFWGEGDDSTEKIGLQRTLRKRGNSPRKGWGRPDPFEAEIFSRIGPKVQRVPGKGRGIKLFSQCPQILISPFHNKLMGCCLLEKTSNATAVPINRGKGEKTRYSPGRGPVKHSFVQDRGQKGGWSPVKKIDQKEGSSDKQ